MSGRLYAFARLRTHQVPFFTAIRYSSVVVEVAEKFAKERERDEVALSVESDMMGYPPNPLPQQSGATRIDIDFAAWEWSKDYWNEKEYE